MLITAKEFGLHATADFRSVRTIYSSPISTVGVQPEVKRDNLGHATVDVMQNVYQSEVLGRTS